MRFRHCEHYLVKRRTLTEFEKAPLKYYISKKYDEDDFKKLFPGNVVDSIDEADIALLPKGRDAHLYMTTFKYASFSILTPIFPATNVQILNIYDVDRKRIGILGRGYAWDDWETMAELLKVKPHFKYFENDADIMNAFERGVIDGIASLDSHPNSFIKQLSERMKLRVIPIEIDNVTLAKYQKRLHNLQRTDIDTRFYISDERTIIGTVGYTLNLYLKKSLPVKRSREIVDILMPQFNVMDNDVHVENHPVVDTWLKEHGYIHDKGFNCIGLIGQGPCTKEKAEMIAGIEERKYPVLSSRADEEPSEISEISKIRRKHVKKMREYCVTDPFNRNKETCDVWDAPCERDRDCPFYKANKNYKNNRGGCFNGFCEMPLNVKRVGYRKYEDKPLCHDAGDLTSRCDMHGEMVSPDYAFANDGAERSMNSLELSMRGLIFPSF